MAGNETDLFKLISFSLEPLKEPEVDLHQTIKECRLLFPITVMTNNFSPLEVHASFFTYHWQLARLLLS